MNRDGIDTSKPTLLVDVDLCVVDPIQGWIDHLNETTNSCISPLSICNFENVNYDLVSYWKEKLEGTGKDGYEYWRKEDLYDNLKPVAFSQDVLSIFKEDGYNIGFVSSLKGNHHKSKANFLKRYFGFFDFFVGTKEKWALGYIPNSVMIDDRLTNLAPMPEGVKLVQLMSPYKQDIDITSRPVLKYTWTMGVGPLKEFIDKEEKYV